MITFGMTDRLIDKLCKDYTPFERRVFKAVCRIPFGKTVAYGQLAKKIGQPRAMRAVGRALGKNPFLLIIPCHRVIRSNGDIGGYRWGKKIKRRLLREEQKLVHY